jgi:DNA-binding NarL/FixJ family response regulator
VGSPVAVLGDPGLEREAIVQVLAAARLKIVDVHLRDADACFVTVLLDTDEEHIWVQARQLQQPVVLVTAGQLGAVAAVDAILRGADAIVAIDCDPVELLHAINVVASGGTLLSDAAARVLLERARTRATGTDVQLTAREFDILGSMARGESVKQTARSLGIAIKTVENLRSRLFRKLGVRNRAQAIVRAHDLSLLTDA